MKVLLESVAPHRSDEGCVGPWDFARWLGIWRATVDSLFLGEKAELAKTQAVRIAGSLLRRLHGGDAREYVTIRRRENG
ncbi:hypothetical protein [Streptomyces sp. NPDC004675]|uniref:hypothetical protein n=1 Tax=Streptomyces sp. NPDC004675 TaxID=3154286 RepID=UPI0033B96B2B